MKGKHFCVTLKNGKFPMKYEGKYMHEVLGCIEGIANSVSGRGFIYDDVYRDGMIETVMQLRDGGTQASFENHLFKITVEVGEI